eukprot:g9144.t1
MLSKAAHAVCVASICLSATTTMTAEAFLVSPVALKSAAATRGHRHHHQRSGVSCVRCYTRAAATMKGDLDGSNIIHRSKLAALRHRLLPRTRGGSTEGEGERRAAGEEGNVVVSISIPNRVRAVMRKTFMAVATAVIVRSSLSPQTASAVGYKPRSGEAPSSRQLRKKQDQEEKRMERVRQEVEKEQQQMLDAATSDLNGEISQEHAVAAAAAAAAGSGEQAEGVSVTEQAVAAAASGSSTMLLPTSDELVERICALPTPQEQENALRMCVPADYKKVWMKLTASQKTALTKLRIENKSYKAVSIGDYRKTGQRDLAPVAIVFSSVLLFSGMRSSLKIMAKQRKRVKAEAAKFDMERDEFMNVEGEAEFDVDIMKELRDMKEKMAGPGDTYAKDTRAYNPEFAAAAGDEEEYDKKIQEALKGTGKGGKTSKGETRKVFTKDEPTNVDVDDSAKASFKGSSDASGGPHADATAQAKKAADAKRLEDLFNSSSIDDPEDDLDLGDNRELLP